MFAPLESLNLFYYTMLFALLYLCAAKGMLYLLIVFPVLSKREVKEKALIEGTFEWKDIFDVSV